MSAGKVIVPGGIRVGRRKIAQADLTAALVARRERLLALAPVVLAADKRAELVDGLLNPEKPAGMMAKMVCIVLAEAINEGKI